MAECILIDLLLVRILYHRSDYYTDSAIFRTVLFNVLVRSGPTRSENYTRPTKHLKRCLPKEEREALFKEHPRPDLHSAVPPKVDKYVQDFLGKCMPKDHDFELSKTQSAILASFWPLTSAWQHITEEGLEEDPEMLMPGAEVLSLIQCTICLISNASELTSQVRRVKILEAVDRSWGKFGSDDFPSAQGTLFGEEFQSSLTRRVEQDTALSKAMSIGERHQKGRRPLPIPAARIDQRSTVFSRRPSCQVRGQTGQKLLPYQRPYGKYRQSSPPSNPNREQSAQKSRALFHKHKLPSWKAQKASQGPQ